MNSDFKIEKVKSKNAFKKKIGRQLQFFKLNYCTFNIDHKGFLILSFDPTAFTKLNFLHGKLKEDY